MQNKFFFVIFVLLFVFKHYVRAATEIEVALCKYFTVEIRSEHILSQMVQSRKKSLKSLGNGHEDRPEPWKEINSVAASRKLLSLCL